MTYIILRTQKNKILNTFVNSLRSQISSIEFSKLLRSSYKTFMMERKKRHFSRKEEKTFLESRKSVAFVV